MVYNEFVRRIFSFPIRFIFVLSSLFLVKVVNIREDIFKANI